MKKISARQMESAALLPVVSPDRSSPVNEAAANTNDDVNVGNADPAHQPKHLRLDGPAV